MRIGSIGGTSIQVEKSFLFLAGFFVVIGLESGNPTRVALLWIPLLFISVLGHELGHAAMLGLLGFGRSQIALAGFGGVTINRRQAKPWQNVVISLAGPGCSFILAGISWLLISGVAYTRVDPMLSVFLPLMIEANVFWGVFNLVPIHPLDGGHALLDVARYATSERRALKFSGWSSIVIAGILVAAGLLMRQFFVVIIAAMLLFQNWQRLQMLNAPPPPPPDDPPLP